MLMKPGTPRTVFLVGAGHVHLHVAARAEEFVERGARVILIDPSEFWYSGLATGMLGGSYEPAEDQVNPRALIEAHGGEFIQDRVEEIWNPPHDGCAWRAAASWPTTICRSMSAVA